MGTRISVGVVADTSISANKAIDAALDEISRIERLMSTYIDSSEISVVNREAANDWVSVSAELFTLIREAVFFSELSRGAFDITFDSVGQHYDYYERLRPDATTQAKEASRIGYRQIELDESRQRIRFSQSGVRINLGGIAKGYAIRQARDVIRRLGHRSAIVTAGGDTLLLGTRGGEPWLVGIQNPRDASDIAVRLPLVNEAISTSGDYERFFELDGVRYHHIISPTTAASVTGVRSASVIGPDAVWTDALSTSVFVLGVEAGLALIETLPDYEAVIVDDQQKLTFTTGFETPDVSE